MSSSRNSFDNSGSPSTSVVERPLVGVPLHCNVLERQMYDESRSYTRSSTAPGNYLSTGSHPYTQQQYINSINKTANEMFHLPRNVNQPKFERPLRRQSFPSQSFYSSAGRSPFEVSFQPGHSKSHIPSSGRNSHYVRRHSNSATHPLHRLYSGGQPLRNVPINRPRVISNLDLESRHMNQEENFNNSKTMSTSRSTVSKSSSETDNTVKSHIPEIIDLCESDDEPQDTAANDVTKKRSSFSQHPSNNGIRNENESEEKDSVFDTIKAPLHKAELKKDKPTSLKRPHYSETTLGFGESYDSSYSTSNKKMRRASGPDRFQGHASSAQWPREDSRSTSPHPTDLPFTLDTLTKEIEGESSRRAQSSDLLIKKQRLRSVLENIFRSHFPGCNLHLVGSSVNGLGNEHSDADFCLMLTQWREIDQRSEARNILLQLNRLLENCNFVEHSQVIFATVPIIKFVDAVSKCECDININNHVGIRNTFLIKLYCKVDERVCPLVMVVKRWAKIHGINDSKAGTLSSYALTLMVLHYLQYACQPPVLPSIQMLYPEFFSDSGDINNLLQRDMTKILKDGNISRSQNWQSLGELLLGFFQYYAHQYNWDKDGISVRIGQIYNKASGTSKKKFIYIEEPFDYNNVAKTVYSEENFNKIKMKIRLAANKLKVSPSLQSIL